MKNLVVHRKYVAVRGKMCFVQIFAHVTIIEIDPANLSQMYVPTNLLRMRVRTIRIQMMSGQLCSGQ